MNYIGNKVCGVSKKRRKKYEGGKVWKKNLVLRTQPYKFINEKGKWIKRSRMVHCVLPHQWLLPKLLNGRVALKGSLNLINFYRKTKEN